MALSTFVKISSVNNLSDARYCAGMGAQLIGFDISPTGENPISLAAIQEITGWLSGVSFAAEWYHSPINSSDLSALLEAVPFEFVVVDSMENLLVLTNEFPEIKAIMKVANEPTQLDALTSMLENSNKVAYILIDSAPSDSGLSDDNKLAIKELSARFAVLLADGLSAENVESLIEELGLSGICLKGGHEIRPGFTHFDTLADILEQLEVD
jgi:phosphoribosylanthranilate isomerase